MAKAKPAAELPEAVEVLDLSDSESLSPALEKMYSEMGVEENGQANVYVHKLLPDGREAKIWNGTPAEYDLQLLAKKFGSGDYRVKLYVQHSSGRFVQKANGVYPVMLEAGEDARLEAIRSGKVDVATGAAPALNPVDLARMIAEAVRAAMPAPVAAPANNLGMLKEVAEIVRTLAPQPSTAPQINPLEMLRFAAEISRDRDSDRDPLDRGVNATGTDVFIKLIDRFAPLFANALGQQQAQPGQPALPSPNQNAAEVQRQPENDPMDALKRGLAFLVMQAQAGNDPDTYVSVVLDNVPEEDLTKFLANPAPLDYLAAINPDVRKTPAISQWFSDLLAEVKAELEAPEESPAPVDGKTPPA